MTSNSVELCIYDLSRGLASLFSASYLGKQIDGVWHTSIVVYNREYFFGSHGVASCNPFETELGRPLKIEKLGETQVPYSVFIDYLNGLSESTYAGSTYNLLQHNCNNFTDEVAQFLCDCSIPKYILDLPNEVQNSFLGAAISTYVSQAQQRARPIAEERHSTPAQKENSPDFEQLNTQIDEARYNSFLLDQRRKTINEKLAKKERKREKKRRKILQEGLTVPPELEEIQMAESVDSLNGAVAQLPSEQALALEEEERREREEKKKARDPPVVYKDLIDVKAEFDALIGLIDGKLSPDEQRYIEELHQYMLENEGSWALSDGFLDFVNRLLNDDQLPAEVRVRIMNILAAAALKDDVILVLHQDRKDHVLMNYAFEIDRHSPAEQEAIALFVANMFENLSSSEWLLYISEWNFKNQQTSNIRVTTKVGVHCLLSEIALLQERGAAIVHNMACKEVFDDVAVELTMALLQYFNSKPAEEQLYRSMKALARFSQISSQEVPQLIQMIGPDPRSFKGVSERIDALIQQISTKLN